VNFDRQSRYKFELGVANQEIQRLNAIIDGKDNATEDLRREIERLSMTIEDALAREIKAEKFVQTFRDDMNKLKSKLEETLDELEIEQDRSAALERELEERQGAAEGFDEREVELKKKIKELEK
jgi:chromosome segregation ATPase